MSRLLWLADALREQDLEVIETDGWRVRGRDTMAPSVVVAHHTASSVNTAPKAMADFLIRGRSDLPGPLSQLMLDRKGRYWVIAAGKANHAGLGGWNGVSGNSHAIGIEACNDGRGEPWPDVQYQAYVNGVAAILRRLKKDESWLCGHKEWAPNRKVDPYGIDMDKMRGDVRGRLFTATVDQLTPAEVRKLRDLIWSWESVGSNPSFPIYTIEHTRRNR